MTILLARSYESVQMPGFGSGLLYLAESCCPKFLERSQIVQRWVPQTNMKQGIQSAPCPDSDCGNVSHPVIARLFGGNRSIHRRKNQSPKVGI